MLNVAKGVSPAAKSDGPMLPPQDGVVCEMPKGVRGPDHDDAGMNERGTTLMEGCIPEKVLAEEEEAVFGSNGGYDGKGNCLWCSYRWSREIP